MFLPERGAAFSLWRGQIKTRVSMKTMIKHVARKYGVDPEIMRGCARTKKYCIPRQHFMWLSHQQPHLSLPMIGAFLGGRDHTTVLHGIRRHEWRMENDDPLIIDIDTPCEDED